MRTLIILLLTLCTTFSYSQVKKVGSSKPFVIGVTEEIESTILSEKRTLNIYLPDGYNENDTAKYPVVYLLDGGADEDFIHIIGLYQFNSFPWINRVPKSIIVGIANTDRKRDLTFPTTIAADKKLYPTTGGSAKFISFIEKELQPYIRHNYRASPSRTIIGESLGGLLATEILFKNPTLFDKYIIISPSLWWDNGSLLNVPMQKLTGKTSVYIGVGKEGLTPGDFSRVMEVDANLLAEKVKKSGGEHVTVSFDYLPQEDHATISHQAVFNALRLLYPAPDQGK